MIPDWINAVAAVSAVIVAGIALWHSYRIDKQNSKLLERQIASEYVYWHVTADYWESKRFTFRNIGTHAAKNVKAYIFIEGTKRLDNIGPIETVPAGESFSEKSETFLSREGAIGNYYDMKSWNRTTHTETSPLHIQFLIEWKDSMGFNNHQELTVKFG